jgi:hypothetical protein
MGHAETAASPDPGRSAGRHPGGSGIDLRNASATAAIRNPQRRLDVLSRGAPPALAPNGGTKVMRKQRGFKRHGGMVIALAVAWFQAGAATAAEPAAPVPVDPQAIAALKKMGAALQALPQFSLQSDASIELVLDDGRKVELDQRIHYVVKRPDKLRIELAGADFERQVIFDGGQLTLWAPNKKYYATTAVQATTLAGLVANASEKFDIELPLTDLFLWGTDAAPVSAITSALHVGGGLIDGDRVEQYALRQDGVDWQVWISTASSLPRKLVIVTHDDPALPEFTARLDWDTKTPLDAQAFTFTPPADASRIAMVPAGMAVVETGEK